MSTKRTEESVSQLIDSFSKLNTDQADPHYKKRQAFVADAFRCLISKLRNQGRILILTIREASMKKGPKADLLNRLQSNYLPSLRHRLTAISIALDPSDLKKDPNSKFKLTLDILSELEKSFDQMNLSISSTQDSENVNDSDQESAENMTVSRYWRLLWKLEELINRLCFFLATCSEFCDLFQFSDSCINTQVDETRKELLRMVASSWELIDNFVEWLKRSEFSIIQDTWQSLVQLIDDALRELSDLVNPTDSTNMDYDDEDNYDAPTLTEQEIDRAKLAVPILKLSRLFLNELSKKYTTNKLMVLISTMKPEQLESLLEATKAISPCVDELVENLSESVDDHEIGTLVRPVEKLVDAFKTSRCIIDLHLKSLPLDQDQLVFPQKWLQTWSEQFCLATQKFLQACDSTQT